MELSHVVSLGAEMDLKGAINNGGCVGAIQTDIWVWSGTWPGCAWGRNNMLSRVASECATLRTCDVTDSPHMSIKAHGGTEYKQIHMCPRVCG